MNDPEQLPGYGEWAHQSGPFAVRYPIALLHEIDFNVKDAARRISHGGMETGGFLFGRTTILNQREAIQIEAFRAIDCEHASGPSFVLSERDMTKMREQLLESGSDPGLEGMRLLGWFIGHARNPLRLSDHEAALFDRLFPRPGQLTLLVKPERFAPSNVAFIVRGQDRKVDRDGTTLAFPLPPLSARAPKPDDEPSEVMTVPAHSDFRLPEALELGAPAARAPVQKAVTEVAPPPKVTVDAGWVEPVVKEPVTLKPLSQPVEVAYLTEPLALEPSVKEPATVDPPVKAPDAPEPVTAPIIKVKPFPSKPVGPRSILDETVEMKVPGRDPLTEEPPLAPSRTPFGRLRTEIAPAGGFLSLEDLRARRLQRLEGGDQPEQFEPPRELTARPATFALMQRPHTAIWRPAAVLLIALVLIGTAFHYYEQYFAPAVPLEVDDRADKLMVSWPPDVTRDGGEASIRVDGGQPFQLSMEEKVLGRAEIAAAGDDVSVELVVNHWYGNARGHVRFVKPVITALP